MFRSARWQLVAWNVLVFSLILAALEIAIYGFFADRIYAEVDKQLQAQYVRIEHLLTAVSSPYVIYSTPSLDPSYRILAEDATGRVDVSSECQAAMSSVQPPPCPPSYFTPASNEAMHEVLAGESDKVLQTVWFGGQPQRVLTFVMPGPYAIQISHPVLGEVADLNKLRLFLVLGWCLGVVLTAAGALFLADRALVRIRQAFSRQRQFTADASHELRTPLALIRANAEMLARHGDRLPEGDGELVGEIIQETDHLNRLISDLLTLARADAERVQLSTKPVDLRHLVEDVHDDLAHIAQSNGVDSTASLNGPMTVPGDEGRLRQLLLILLDNALKYTDPGGRVDISLDREDGRARLVVMDTGIGIPAKDLPHVFERFYRVDRAREHESGGTGLGLAIAKWIVQAHHGTIKVESAPGKGTKFQVDLPAA